MEKFELIVDVNTRYIKVIRFIGALGLGFILGTTLSTFKYEGFVDWMNAISGLLCSFVLTIFPGVMKKHSLTIDDTGIYLQNYTFHWGQKTEITWEKIHEIGVQKNIIKIKNRMGSIEKINLPIHTKHQLEELKFYVKQMTEIKNLEYTT